MADQIEAGKTVMNALIGPLADNITVSKTVMWLIVQPGDGDDTVERQAHVFAQKIRRD